LIKIISIAVTGAIAGALAAGVPLFMQLEDSNHHAELLMLDKTALEQEITSLENDLADADNAIISANDDLDDLQGKYDSTASELSTTKEALSIKTNELSTANAQINSLDGDLANARQEIEGLSSEISSLNNQIYNLENQLENANSEIVSLNTDLDEINAKYPLEDFPDYDTLSVWVKAHVQPIASSLESWFSHALRVQEAGANDGYYVSAFIYASDGYIFVLNSALVGDMLYAWDPEDSTIYEWWEGGR